MELDESPSKSEVNVEQSLFHGNQFALNTNTLAIQTHSLVRVDAVTL